MILRNWSRSAAALQLLDEHVKRVGWLDESGVPRPFTSLYLGLLNHEARSLNALKDCVSSPDEDPAAALQEWLLGEATEEDEG
jgi:hypothetical protein